jgi:hypothetical protein
VLKPQSIIVINYLLIDFRINCGKTYSATIVLVLMMPPKIVLFGTFFSPFERLFCNFLWQVFFQVFSVKTRSEADQAIMECIRSLKENSHLVVRLYGLCRLYDLCCSTTAICLLTNQEGISSNCVN